MEENENPKRNLVSVDNTISKSVYFLTIMSSLRKKYWKTCIALGSTFLILISIHLISVPTYAIRMQIYSSINFSNA